MIEASWGKLSLVPKIEIRAKSLSHRPGLAGLSMLYGITAGEQGAGTSCLYLLLCVGCMGGDVVLSVLLGHVAVTLLVAGPRGLVLLTWSAHNTLGLLLSISISALRATLVEYSLVDNMVEYDSIKASRVGVVALREDGRPLV